MEIIIRSRENGWETERRLELPEDAGLVKSILRTLGDPAKRNALWGEEEQGSEGSPVREDGATEADFVTTKRRMDPPKLAGRATENQVEEQPAEEAPATVPEQPAHADPPAHVERITFETGYRGFLILTCGACGKSYTINAREPVTETACKACGHVTALKEMAAVEMCCPDCGKTWRYKTNSEQADVSARCISCGAVMVSEWDRKLRRYVPQKLKREDD